MTYWHKFKMVFNSCFITSSVGRLKLLRCAASGVHMVLLTYREEPKQPRRLIAGLPLLEFSPALESWSNIYTGPTSCLIIPQMFSSLLFIHHLYLCRLGCSLNALSSTSWVDTPLLLIGYKFVRPRLSFLKRFWKIHATISWRRPGHPRKLTPRQERLLMRRVEENRHASSLQLSKEVESQTGVTISRDTIWRTLQRNDMHGCVHERSLS